MTQEKPKCPFHGAYKNFCENNPCECAVKDAEKNSKIEDIILEGIGNHKAVAHRIRIDLEKEFTIIKS